MRISSPLYCLFKKQFVTFFQIEEGFQHFIESDMGKDEVLSRVKMYLLYVAHDKELLLDKAANVLSDCFKLTEKFPDEALPIDVISEALMQGCEYHRTKHLI